MASGDEKKQLMPNGRPITPLPKPPKRDDSAIFEKVFPDTDLGKMLQGITIVYLIKQEHRMGWAYKGACSEQGALLAHQCESVAGHMWGLSYLIKILTKHKPFREEIPDFDRLAAIEMALNHDVPELITTDITIHDNVDEDEKRKAEKEAMRCIASYFPKEIGDDELAIYEKYEDRKTIEAKFVKDCDKLDFLIYAFVIERQGFIRMDDFYENTMSCHKWFTKYAEKLAKLLCMTRDDLIKSGRLYNPKP